MTENEKNIFNEIENPRLELAAVAHNELTRMTESGDSDFGRALISRVFNTLDRDENMSSDLLLRNSYESINARVNHFIQEGDYLPGQAIDPFSMKYQEQNGVSRIAWEATVDENERFATDKERPHFKSVSRYLYTTDRAFIVEIFSESRQLSGVYMYQANFTKYPVTGLPRNLPVSQRHLGSICSIEVQEPVSSRNIHSVLNTMSGDRINLHVPGETAIFDHKDTILRGTLISPAQFGNNFGNTKHVFRRDQGVWNQGASSASGYINGDQILLLQSNRSNNNVNLLHRNSGIITNDCLVVTQEDTIEHLLRDLVEEYETVDSLVSKTGELRVDYNPDTALSVRVTSDKLHLFEESAVIITDENLLVPYSFMLNDLTIETIAVLDIPDSKSKQLLMGFDSYGRMSKHLYISPSEVYYANRVDSVASLDQEYQHIALRNAFNSHNQDGQNTDFSIYSNRDSSSFDDDDLIPT